MRKQIVGEPHMRGERLLMVAVCSHFHLIVQMHDPRYALAAVDTKLPFMKRSNATADRYNAFLRTYFYRT
jgi:hypothetical protein